MSYGAADPAVYTPDSCQSCSTAASALAAPLPAWMLGSCQRKLALMMCGRLPTFLSSSSACSWPGQMPSVPSAACWRCNGDPVLPSVRRLHVQFKPACHPARNLRLNDVWIESYWVQNRPQLVKIDPRPRYGRRKSVDSAAAPATEL